MLEFTGANSLAVSPYVSLGESAPFCLQRLPPSVMLVDLQMTPLYLAGDLCSDICHCLESTARESGPWGLQRFREISLVRKRKRKIKSEEGAEAHAGVL